MAAAATAPITLGVTNAPVISQETRRALEAERRRLMADPDRSLQPADLQVDATYVFRTNPGTYRRVVHDLPMKPEISSFKDDKRYEFALRQWTRLVAKPAFPKAASNEAAADSMAAMLENIREHLGDTRLIFTRIRRANESFYATDDEVIALYLRSLIAARVGEFAEIYEVSGRSRVVGGRGTENEMAFPDTTLGWNAARTYQREHGGSIELVTE